ncbi:MAG: glycosyltransferase family 2 protein [Actinobacteria bacterium]|nr:glycosyltransferase family 2 protein [Actinomycetota bacterium]
MTSMAGWVGSDPSTGTSARDPIPVRRPLLSVVLPAYNEEALIAETLRLVCGHLRTLERRYDWEVLVVDDGSKDDTSSIVADFAIKEPRVRLLRHVTNFNLGQALRYAFNRARGDFVITLDSDLSYGPDHIELLADTIIETRAKIVIASPYIEGGKVTAVPKLREIMSRMANKLLALTAKGSLTTITGMVRAYDRRFLLGLDLKATDFEINTEIIYKAQLLRALIVEVPAHLDWSRQQAVGSRRTSSIRVARAIASQAFSSFLFRPFMYFIVPGLVILVLSLYSLGWAVYHSLRFWATPEVTDFSDAVLDAFELSPHSFLVGGISLVVAIQLISLGILSAQQKRYFDELFHLGTAAYREQLRLGPDRAPIRGVSAAPDQPDEAEKAR